MNMENLFYMFFYLWLAFFLIFPILTVTIVLIYSPIFLVHINIHQILFNSTINSFNPMHCVIQFSIKNVVRLQFIEHFLKLLINNLSKYNIWVLLYGTIDLAHEYARRLCSIVSKKGTPFDRSKITTTCTLVNKIKIL
jgi:hypothetical protein